MQNLQYQLWYLGLETNYKKASKKNERVGGPWGRGAYAMKEKIKSYILPMGQKCRVFNIGIILFFFCSSSFFFFLPL